MKEMEINYLRYLWRLTNERRIDCNLEPERFTEEFEQALNRIEEVIHNELPSN